ncbi:hypothetical protein UlMin_007766 [Ulmus minor]
MAASSLSQFLPSFHPSKPSPHLVSLPQRLHLPKIVSGSAPQLTLSTPTSSSSAIDIGTVVCPSLANSNTFFFKSAYNVQVIPQENEPEEKLLGRFRREVLRAGVLQESKRRRFFENSQEKRKRKARDAARRNRRRPQLSKDQIKAKEETTIRKEDNDGDDQWEQFDVDLPYC